MIFKTFLIPTFAAPLRYLVAYFAADKLSSEHF